MKKKVIILAIVIACLTLLAIVGWRLLENQKVKGTGAIVLQDLPASYCPTSAQVLIRSLEGAQTVFDNSIVIADCRRIDLGAVLITDTETYKIFIKLPKALAFSVQSVLPITEDVSYYPVLGDANGDNTIDKSDEEIVLESLSKTSGESAQAEDADIDENDEVTVIDLSLVQLHQGVGVSRPDGKDWSLK